MIHCIITSVFHIFLLIYISFRTSTEYLYFCSYEREYRRLSKRMRIHTNRASSNPWASSTPRTVFHKYAIFLYYISILLSTTI